MSQVDIDREPLLYFRPLDLMVKRFNMRKMY